jgi:uncharacterized protein
MIVQLGPTESREILSRQRLGRLGCCLNNEAYVVPVNYLFEDECIYIHSLSGRKINFLRANPRACLQVDDIRDDYNWRSVIATGWYEEVTEAGEREYKLATLFRHLPHLTPVESKIRSGAEPVILFRIRIEHITGVGERW